MKDHIVVGVDFDNTIADYDELMQALAFKAGLIDEKVGANKQEIRDHIRSLENGEIKWQKLQAMAYGKSMPQAKLIEGVQEFFLSCHHQGIPVYIVSHKTQFAAQDEAKVDLHDAALRWMEAKGFFQRGQVFFEPSRQQKAERVRQLGCTHFIDDLPETFRDASFPKEVQKILYAPHHRGKVDEDLIVMSSWEGIYDSFFANIRK